MEQDLFSVVQYYDDDSFEYVARNVGPEAAASVFAISALCAEAQVGLTKRITIMIGDCVGFEWVYGQGTRKVGIGA
jgi:hypothetical protein